MKVLHVYRTYFPETQGGLEETIRQICRGTAPLGVESKVLSLAPTAYTTEIDGSSVCFAKNQLEIASCGMGLGAFSQHRQLMDWADVVNYHFPWPFADLLHFAAKTSRLRRETPVVVTYHSDIVRQRSLGRLYEPLMHSFLGDAEAIVSTSDNYLRSSEVLQRHKERVEVIPIGIDPDSIGSPDEAIVQAVRQRLGDRFFLFVGVLRYYKGLHVLIEAAANSDFRVAIAGDGPLYEELNQQVNETAASNVTLLGRVSDNVKSALLDTCRGVVLPSTVRSEAFGVFLVEGALSSRPLVSTEIDTGTSFVNFNGETGITVPPNDSAALREAMQKIADDDDLSEKMGQKARQRYEQHFTAKRMAERYHSLYSRLCQHRLDARQSSNG